MNECLKASRISVSFKAVDALKDVSLDVAPGECVALLGHNGAGKTTLFRVILGFLKQASGSALVAGEPAGSRLARNVVSYLPEAVVFPKMLTGREVVQFYADLKRMARSEVNKLLETVDLADAADRRVETYSKGMRQRLGLAQALVGAPKLLLLDEPTSGLDPISRERFFHLIREVANRGSAVLLSSHGLSELEARTDRVAILRKGELVANAPVATLQREADLPIRIRVRADEAAIQSLQENLGGVRGNGASIEVSGAMSAKMQMLSKISAFGSLIEDVDFAPPTLDEIYRYYSNRDGVEQAP